MTRSKMKTPRQPASNTQKYSSFLLDFYLTLWLLTIFFRLFFLKYQKLATTCIIPPWLDCISFIQNQSNILMYMWNMYTQWILFCWLSVFIFNLWICGVHQKEKRWSLFRNSNEYCILYWKKPDEIKKMNVTNGEGATNCYIKLKYYSLFER